MFPLLLRTACLLVGTLLGFVVSSTQAQNATWSADVEPEPNNNSTFGGNGELDGTGTAKHDNYNPVNAPTVFTLSDALKTQTGFTQAIDLDAASSQYFTINTWDGTTDQSDVRHRFIISPDTLTGDQALWETGGLTDGSGLALLDDVIKFGVNRQSANPKADSTVSVPLSAIGYVAGSDFIQIDAVANTSGTDGFISLRATNLDTNATIANSSRWRSTDWSGSDPGALGFFSNPTGIGGNRDDQLGAGPWNHFDGQIVAHQTFADADTGGEILKYWRGGDNGGTSNVGWQESDNWAITEDGSVLAGPDVDDVYVADKPDTIVLHTTDAFGTDDANQILQLNGAVRNAQEIRVLEDATFGSNNTFIVRMGNQTGTLNLFGDTPINFLSDGTETNRRLRFDSENDNNGNERRMALEFESGGTSTIHVGGATDRVSITSLIQDGANQATALVKTGSGTLRIGNDGVTDNRSNTFTASIAVNDGTLELSKNAGLNAINGDLTIGDSVGAAGSAVTRLINSNQIPNAKNVDIKSDGLFDLNGKKEVINELTGAGQVALGSGTLSIGSDDGGGTYFGTISGSNGKLTKLGSGDVILEGTTSYTGKTTVSGGSLKMVNSATGNAIRGDNTAHVYEVADGATLEFLRTGGNAGISRFNLSGDGTFKTNNSAGLEITQTSLGSTVSMGSGALFHVETGTYRFGFGGRGDWTKNKSDLLVEGTFIGAGSAIYVDALNGNGVVQVGGTVGGTDLHGNGLTVGVDNGDGNFSGKIMGAPDSSRDSFAKSGTGTQVLSGINSYNGTTTIDGGILQFAKQVSLYNNNNANWTEAKILVNNGGTLAVNVGGAGEFTTADLDTLKALGSGTGGFQSGSSLGIDTANAPGTVTYGSVIGDPNGGANSLGLTKLGAGTLELTEINTYTGDTIVAEGTLIVNGSIATSAHTTIADGATLTGSGTLGATTYNAGAVISPGNSIDTLSQGNTVWNGLTTYEFEFQTDGTGLAGTDWDLLDITGTLDLTGASSAMPIEIELITMANTTTPGLLGSWDPLQNHVWAGFVQTTGGISGFSRYSFDIDPSGFQNDLNPSGRFLVMQDGNNLNLVYNAVPEPGTSGILLLLVSGLGLRRRRRKLVVAS